MQSRPGRSHMVADRMRQLGLAVFSPGPALAGLALIALGLSGAGGAGCTLLLDTNGVAPSSKCETDDDCAKFSNAACDDIKKHCVPRLPLVDAGVVAPTGTAGTSGLTCELSFDNKARIFQSGPDGGLRALPLPDAGP